MNKTHLALGLFVLTLVLASLVNPINAVPGHVADVDPFLQSKTRSLESGISLLVASTHDLTSAEVSVLRAFGTVTTVAGPVAVLRTHVDSLADIRTLTFVSKIEGSHPLGVYLDKSVPDIGADVVWREVKDPNGRSVTGAGIVLGFVDTGIDVTHPDFSFPNGTTKILYVWDQTTRGPAPSGFGYGYECNSDVIQQRKCPEFDSFGHGTHVAGIAASSGRATGNFTGVAPDAAIIFVKSGHQVCGGASWTFDTTEILDGIHYIIEKAAQLGRRAVINLSLGGNIGGHDGLDPLERGLDAFVKLGTPVVVAAGNSADDNDHVHGQLSQGMNVTVNVTVMQTTTDLAVDIWYSSQDLFDASLTTPEGEIYTVPTPSGGAMSNYGIITAAASSSDIGKELYFEINSNSTLPSQGWSITLKANRVNSKGSWDAWVDTATCSFPGASFLPGEGYTIDRFGTIGVPGTARHVVTVGAYITKTSWRGMNGQTYGRASAPVGDIASFSSLGPTRDGRIKPDVAAPGLFIASARSSVIPKSTSDPDAFHRILAGTSMATPHVAGLIALMLQYAPDLDADQLPGILRETARSDMHTGLLTNGSPVWGFGKADARAATGLSRLTLVVTGIPDEITVSVSIDGKQNLKLAGHSWKNLYFPKGTMHTFVVDEQLQQGQRTRYILEGGPFTFAGNTLQVLNYTVQYLLTVNSEYGKATGSGWYNANSTVTINATERVTPSGMQGYFGAEYKLAYWITDDGKIVSDSVVMDRPKTVTAVYALAYPVQTYAVIAVLLIVALFAIIIVRRHRNDGTGVNLISS